MTAQPEIRCWICRRNQGEVEQEIQQKSQFLSIDGDIFSDLQVCEVCNDVLRAVVGGAINDFMSDRFKDIEDLVKQVLGKVLMQSGKIMSGELKVEKKPAPIRVEKVADEEGEISEIAGETTEEEDDDEEEEEEGEEEDDEDEEEEEDEDEEEDEPKGRKKGRKKDGDDE